MTQNHDDLRNLTIREAATLLKKKNLSPVDLTQAHLDHIDAVDGRLHAFFTLMADNALADAHAAEAEIQKGNYRGPLHGIPVAHKDQYDVAGVRTTARARGAGAGIPSRDAGAVRRLKEAGTVLLGKLAMQGLLIGGPESFSPEPARNPWNLERIPGGSSSGSGASVAAGLCMGSLGEDTAGSIRGPASMCGVVGLVPTYGRVTRQGLAPLSWSLDHCGPLTRTVEDTALILQTIAGHDPNDPFSSTVPVPSYTDGLDQGIKGMRVGVVNEYFYNTGTPGSNETMSTVRKALSALEELGASVQDVQLPDLDYVSMATLVLWFTEGYAYHRKSLQQQPEIFGEPLRHYLYAGALFSGADYTQALRVRRQVKREVDRLLTEVDVLIWPTLDEPPPTFGEYDVLATVKRPSPRAPINFMGIPAISIPCGFTEDGLPIGMQIAGRSFDEPTLLRAAHTYEQAMGWHKKRPPLWS